MTNRGPTSALTHGVSNKMARSLNGLGFALVTALVLSGCTVTTDGSRADGSSGTDGGADLPGDDPQSGNPKSGELSFSPANVPADAALAATGDWIFNTDTCGSTKVTIDTAKGTVSCAGQPKGAFTFKAIAQVDTSQGTLTAGLFVTRRLVIEPSMVVDVVGNRPLVIVALETATIQGALRASAIDYQSNGGGFDGVREVARGNGPGGGQGAVARVGAGGGGHCGVGGGEAAGGKAYGRPTNSPLVGGSAGGGSRFASSGAGGGAVQIVAGTSMEVSATGSIAVSGAGSSWLSGGGGAGGAILLEGPLVSVFGVLAANGGGGSETGSSNDGADGSASADPAKGGPGNCSICGSGGDGAAGATIAGQTGTQIDAAQGQGGGGGGAGWIRLNTKSGSATIGATAVISPALSTPCATQGTPAAR